MVKMDFTNNFLKSLITIYSLVHNVSTPVKKNHISTSFSQFYKLKPEPLNSKLNK